MSDFIEDGSVGGQNIRGYMDNERLDKIKAVSYTHLDIIRSKDREGRQAFYMVSTTMHLSPGVPIMKSYDLVHLSLIHIF